MNPSLLEINDYEISLSYQDNNGCVQRIAQSGYALINQDSISFGDDALAQQKLAPNKLYCRYWQRLSGETVVSDNPKVHHFADIAYFQLQNIFAQATATQALILVVPGYYNQQQLSLLLGVIQSFDISVTAIINNGLLAISHPFNESAYRYFDINLHSFEQYDLVIDQRLAVATSHQCNDKGVYGLHRHLATWLNSLFISRCRFDAFHHAHTEQALYQTLPSLIDKSESITHITIEGRTLTVSRDEISQQICHFFKPLIESINDDRTPIILSHRLCTLLPASVTQALTTPNTDDYLQIVSAVADNTESAHNQASTPIINELGPLPRYDSSAQATPCQSSGYISHLLYNDNAYPIGNAVYLMASNDDELTRHDTGQAIAKITENQHQVTITPIVINGLSVNGIPLSCQRQLSVGDILMSHHSNTLVRCIHVAKELN